MSVPWLRQLNVATLISITPCHYLSIDIFTYCNRGVNLYRVDIHLIIWTLMRIEMTSPKATELLDLAEHYIRRVGVNGFSFRDLAEDAGIKSASVHYHFATKEQLAAAVTKRYAANFFTILKEAEQHPAPHQLDLFISLFQRALQSDGRMCLFCVLGAEYAALPEMVQTEVRSFFERANKLLVSLLGKFGSNARKSKRELDAQARTIIATLEGAMIVARASNDLKTFDTIVDSLRSAGIIPTI